MKARGTRTRTLATLSVLGAGMVLVYSVASSAGEIGSGGTAADPERAAAIAQQAVHPQFFHTAGRVDYEAAGTGMRNLGSGTIRLRGIPPNSSIARAFLYWAFICVSSAPCPATSQGEFEGVTITGTLFATAPQPCWAGTTIGAYKVDVTSLLPRGPGNGYNRDYRLTGFPSGINTGQSPWDPRAASEARSHREAEPPGAAVGSRSDLGASARPDR
jgi:hypothetical protein